MGEDQEEHLGSGAVVKIGSNVESYERQGWDHAVKNEEYHSLLSEVAVKEAESTPRSNKCLPFSPRNILYRFQDPSSGLLR